GVDAGGIASDGVVNGTAAEGLLGATGGVVTVAAGVPGVVAVSGLSAAATETSGLDAMAAGAGIVFSGTATILIGAGDVKV
ncbi:MAG: hypothetical protein AAGF66_21050, partial [Cyanobacteria bacterium P01_H01_bin.119]